MIERINPYSIPETTFTVPETVRILPPIPRKLDLPPPQSNDLGVRRGQAYEQDCFDFLASVVPKDHFIFGPNLIMAAFRKTFFTHDPTPDAMIFEPRGSNLALIEMSEFKIGKIESGKKIKGFKKLMGKFKTAPDKFNGYLQDAVRDMYTMPRLILPPANEIEFTFATPRTVNNTGEIYRHDSPCKVFYFKVPRLREAS